jgi:transcription initiation factor IIE alpha subunit
MNGKVRYVMFLCENKHSFYMFISDEIAFKGVCPKCGSPKLSQQSDEKLEEIIDDIDWSIYGSNE